jgi:hypothetical protein
VTALTRWPGTSVIDRRSKRPAHRTFPRCSRASPRHHHPTRWRGRHRFPFVAAGPTMVLLDGSVERSNHGEVGHCRRQIERVTIVQGSGPIRSARARRRDRDRAPLAGAGPLAAGESGGAHAAESPGAPAGRANAGGPRSPAGSTCSMGISATGAPSGVAARPIGSTAMGAITRCSAPCGWPAGVRSPKSAPTTSTSIAAFPDRWSN